MSVKSFRAPSSFSSKKYPDFIRKNPILKKEKKPYKIFPKIGLNNSEVSFKRLEISGNPTRFDPYIIDSLFNFINLFIQKSTILYKDAFNICTIIHDSYYDSYNIDQFEKCIDYRSEPLGLTEKFSFQDFLKALLKKEYLFERYFGIVGGTNYKKKFLAALQPDNTIIKDYKDLSVCFSSDGNKGIWDIATMSMRGVKSCMRWRSSHSRSLIGSILDAYCGVIYVTDRKQTNYGKSILARSVVRLVIDKGRLALFIEQPYYKHGANGFFSKVEANGYDPQGWAHSIFYSFIKSKINKAGFDINIINYNGLHDAYIPLNKSTDMNNYCFDDNEDNYNSYSDADLGYYRHPSLYYPKKVSKKTIRSLSK